MRPEEMRSSAAPAAGSNARTQAMGIGRHLLPPSAAHLPDTGRHSGSRSGLLAPAREMAERGERLRRRVRATPPCARPDQESFLPHLPEILANSFDSVSITFACGALRSYALRAEALGATVHIATTGRWYTADGTAEGCGLVALTMWLKDVGITSAVVVLRDLVARAGAAALAGGGA